MSLVAFFWSYFRRYLFWAWISVLALVVFALSTGLLIALANRVYDDVLLAGDAKPAIALIAAGESRPGAASGVSDGVKRRFADLYQHLKERFGIRDENRFRSPRYFAPILFVLVYLLRSLVEFVSAYSFQRIGFGITTDIRNDLYDSILGQSMRFHSEHPTGELFSRLINDVAKLQNAVSSRMLDLFQQSAALVVLVASLFLIHFQLAVISLVATPVFLYPIVRFGKGMRRTSHNSQERMAAMSSLLAEGIKGNRVVKAFGMEKFESDRFRTASARHLRVNLRAQVLSLGSSPVIESLAAIGGGALAIYCGGMIRRGELDSALVLTFLTALFLLYEPIRKLNKANLVVQEAMAAAQRVHAIMALPNLIVNRPTAPPISTVERGVRFEGVAFGYGSKTVIDRFDLEIKAGEVVALVGPSGAGKTTIVNLLPRFIDPDRGRLTIDGVDIRALPLPNLRSLIGIVTQETILFNDSVRNNIAYGGAEVPLERIREAAAAAYADEFIMDLEGGYDSVIGEGGHQLSGGQQQRIAIARALLKNAPILILDEATSHLDSESELLVQRAIYNLMEGRTALVIAHRLSTVIRADRIVVLENGVITEEGSHHQLLALGGAYKRLYDLQFRSG